MRGDEQLAVGPPYEAEASSNKCTRHLERPRSTEVRICGRVCSLAISRRAFTVALCSPRRGAAPTSLSRESSLGPFAVMYTCFKTPRGAFDSYGVGVPVWVLIGVVVAYPTYRAIRCLVRRRSYAYCGNCEYCLIGLQVPRCPECGTPFPPHMVMHRDEMAIVASSEARRNVVQRA